MNVMATFTLCLAVTFTVSTGMFLADMVNVSIHPRYPIDAKSLSGSISWSFLDGIAKMAVLFH